MPQRGETELIDKLLTPLVMEIQQEKKIATLTTQGMLRTQKKFHSKTICF
jgi:hypothetical protein